MQRRDAIYKHFRHESLTETETKFVESIIKFVRMRPYRSPKTLNERSQTATMLEDEDIQEFGVRIRAKRHPNNIPNDWDDIQRSRRSPIRHKRPWRSRKQRAMIAELKSGYIIIEEKE